MYKNRNKNEWDKKNRISIHVLVSSLRTPFETSAGCASPLAIAFGQLEGVQNTWDRLQAGGGGGLEHLYWYSSITVTIFSGLNQINMCEV